MLWRAKKSNIQIFCVLIGLTSFKVANTYITLEYAPFFLLILTYSRVIILGIICMLHVCMPGTKKKNDHSNFYELP